MSRVRGWELRLAEVVELHSRQPFSWGQSDCLTLVGDVVQALTLEDPLAPFRGRYSTARGARSALTKAGFADVGAALAAHLEEGAPAMARRGDVGLVETVTRRGVELAAVVVTGVNVVGKSAPARTGQTGQTTLGRDRLVRAFRVGW